MTARNERPGSGESPTSSWTVLTAQTYPEGTIGRNFFPGALEERKRPWLIFGEEPLLTPLAPTPQHKQTLRKLQDKDVWSLGDLMFKSLEELDDTDTGRRFLEHKLRSRFEKFGQEYAITPHGRLLAAVMEVEAIPVKPEEEEALINEVENSVSLLAKEEQGILRLYFGLAYWKPNTIRDIAEMHSLKEEEAAEVLETGLRKLRIQAGMSEEDI